MTDQLLRPSDKPITRGSTQIPYLELDYTIAAGARQIIYQNFDFFRVLALSAATLRVRFGRNGLFSKWSNAGIGLRLDEVVDQVELENTGGVSITITVGLGLGLITDDRLNVSGTVTVSGSVAISSPLFNNAVVVSQRPYDQWITTSTGQVSIGTTAVQIWGTSSTRRGQWLNAGDADLFISDSSSVTTSNGFRLYAGQGIAIPQGMFPAMWGIRSVAGVNCSYMALGN